MADENQVIDRVHRIGQTKEVLVNRYAIEVRLIPDSSNLKCPNPGAQNTIEERIIQLQDNKSIISGCTLADTDNMVAKRLDFSSFMRLFGLSFPQQKKQNEPTPEATPDPEPSIE